MKRHPLRLATVIAGIASCTHGTSIQSPAAGGDGMAGSGAGGAGGSVADGNGGTPASGVGGTGPSMSAGSVTLQLKLGPGAAYCDETAACNAAVNYISVRAPSGAVLLPALGSDQICPAPPCDPCQPTACPNLACPPRGVMAHDDEVIWNGSYLVMSTCGPATTRCRQPVFAQPGQYVAVMCATPGRLVTPAGGGLAQCTKTGDRQCIEIPFTYPSSTPVVGTLGGQDGPICGNQTCGQGQMCCTACDGSKSCGSMCPGHACPRDTKCGSTECKADETCVHPCCGGTAVPCLPAPDGGACPSGSISCGMLPGGHPGCATPCTPPPPFCQPTNAMLPAGCAIYEGGQAICVCA
jgi:hypothetical protein